MIACLFSGGKDSTLALHKASALMKVNLLISMIPDNDYSYMFHKPNIMLTKLQAQSLGINHIMIRTEGNKELELDDLENAIIENNVDTIITGAVASNYQKKRIDIISEKHNIKHYAPLWGIDPIIELNELSNNYNVIITQISAEGFDESMLGKRIDKEMIKKLILLNKKYKINMLFEGGEAESFVLNAPMFKKKIEIIRAHKEIEGSVGKYIIDDAKLIK
ncbi:MAG: diphthine--ammonia ligase [Candidatus Marsarchaeota archaeon]|jgi:ABC transporter with metal-binding/Fe-S-binding domain ATP-binding protein|nr:diphthine--ammonia ligase [Candidatus Marsarchaeota archaeon]